MTPSRMGSARLNNQAQKKKQKKKQKKTQTSKQTSSQKSKRPTALETLYVIQQQYRIKCTAKSRGNAKRTYAKSSYHRQALKLQRQGTRCKEARVEARLS
jgi:methylthioribose-1-phosphate isomerase